MEEVDKQIGPDLEKFYRQLKSVKQSGWNEDNYIKEAAGNLYKEEVGKPFKKYAKCVPILHKQVTKI